jgi:UDP-glucose 4-epimerase
MNSLQGSRVLITGGAGLVGSHIADRLIQEDVAEVVILDNFVRGRHENLDTARAGLRKLTLVEGDITDPATVHDAMQASTSSPGCASHHAVRWDASCVRVSSTAPSMLTEAAVEKGRRSSRPPAPPLRRAQLCPNG